MTMMSDSHYRRDVIEKQKKHIEMLENQVKALEKELDILDEENKQLIRSVFSRNPDIRMNLAQKHLKELELELKKLKKLKNSNK